MSHYMDLSDEDKIKLARDSVRCRVPIATVIANWLRENNLYDMVTNPRRTNATTTSTPCGSGTTGPS